jgi:tryptophanyl-tRNA synthetase
MSITTDSTAIDNPKDINTPLFKIYSLMLNADEKKELESRFYNPGLKYGDVKTELADNIIDFFQPYREKRKYLENHLDYVTQVLKIGAQKAAVEANKYLTAARTVMGLNYAK